MKGNKIGKAIANTGKFIGENKMSLIYAGITLGIVVIAVPLVKTIIKRLNPDIKGVKDTTKSIDVNKLKNLTITPNQAQRMAEQLLQAFSVSYGTDKSTIEKVFDSLKTDDDFRLLYKEFGLRTYSNTNQGSPVKAAWGVLEDLGGYQDMDLIGWLNEELDFLDWGLKNKIKEKLPSGFVLG